MRFAKFSIHEALWKNQCQKEKTKEKGKKLISVKRHVDYRIVVEWQKRLTTPNTNDQINASFLLSSNRSSTPIF